jgi:type I restriction enzyme M protein
LSYGDYVEQLTFLLFLKMADEPARPPFNKPSPIPKWFGWDAQSILQKAFSGRLATADASG